MIRTILSVCLVTCALSCFESEAQQRIVDSLKTFLRCAQRDTVRFDLYGKIAWAYLAPRIALDSGRAYADTLSMYAKNNARWKMRNLFYYGAYERFKGNHTAALRYLRPYLDYYTVQGDSNWVADGLFQLAVVYSQLGDYAQSIAVTHRLLNIDRALHLPRNVAHSLNNLGVAYFNAGQTEKAIEMYEEALAVYDSLHAGESKSSVYLNLGNVYTRIKDYARAKHYYNEALILDKQNQDRHKIALDLANVAYLFDGQEIYDSALYYHQRSYEIRKQLPDRDNLTRSIIGMAFGYLRTKRYDKAEQYFKDAIQQASEIRSKPMLIDASLGLSEFYAATEDYREALKYLTLHKAVSDSVLNEENQKQINSLSVRYEDERKTSQIASLEKEMAANAERANAAAFQRKAWTGIAVLVALVAIVVYYSGRQRVSNLRKIAWQEKKFAEAEFRRQAIELELKALKAQINPHFFFNCLNSINRLILDGNIDKASCYLEKFSAMVRKVLENASEEQVSLTDEITMLRNYIELEELRFKEKVTCTVHVDPSIDADNAYVPPMILQPFVENAIWHGLSSGNRKDGNISIAIARADQGLDCTIADNGIGRTLAALQNDKSGKRRSLGLRLTEERLRLLDSEHRQSFIRVNDLVEDNHPAGTLVNLYIPLV
ncbi:MAG TPA: tetratricopeptide repeat protein [Chryseolinea sp.]